MPQIKSRFEFEPDRNARQQWLGTRKRESSSYGGTILPGFYQTADSKDGIWVFIAFVVEFFAVILTVQGGMRKGGVYLIGAIGAVIFFIFFDIVGTILHHKPMPERCRLKNTIATTTEERSKIGYINQLSGYGKAYTFFGILLIVTSAILKIGAIFLLGRFSLSFIIILMIFYLLVIYIHINHTGYWLAERSVNKEFEKQHAEWARKANNTNLSEDQRKLNNAEIRRSPFESDIKLEKIEIDKPIEAERHKIALLSEDKEKGIYKYEITTIGILLDEDIQLFVNTGQKDAGSKLIAEICLKHQVEKIH